MVDYSKWKNIEFLRIRRALPQCGVRFASDKTEIEDPENLSFLPRDEAEMEEENAAREAKIEKMRNRSGLKTYHRLMQHGECPPSVDEIDYHKSLKYRRALFGMYGKSSKVDPSILWPSKVELADMKYWEEVAHPYTVKELIERAKERKKQEEEDIIEQEKIILEKVSRVQDEILEFKSKISRQLDKEVAVKEKHEKRMKELRKYFGYQIAPNDPRVAVLLEKRELEEKKAKKDAKRKMKNEMKAKLLQEKTALWNESETKVDEGKDSKKEKDETKDEEEN